MGISPERPKNWTEFSLGDFNYAQGKYNKDGRAHMVLTEGKVHRCGQRDFRGVGTQARVHRPQRAASFDVEILRIPPGKAPYSYHSHSAQWEFYHVISGSGVVRHKDGTTPIEAGDAFIFKPGEPHQITNDTTEDMILYVVADNPIGDTYYQPDSNKWGVPIPERRNVRSQPLDYFDGEE